MTRKRRSAKATAGRTCVAEGCTRAVQPGRVLCPVHVRGAYGHELEAAVGRMARQVERAFSVAHDARNSPASEEAAAIVAGEQQQATLATFERRVARGDYGELFDAQLREVMAQAAAERGIAEEIGALRVVLARLMTDPAIDPLQLAHGVARVAGTTVRAMRMQRELEAGVGNDTHREIVQTLIALEPIKELRRQEAQEEMRREREARESAAGGDGGLGLVSDRERLVTMFPREE